MLDDMAKLTAPGPVCVIGAGVSGLLAARHLLELGIGVRVIERRVGLGGLWNPDQRYGGAYRSAHLISSKHTTELPDFPMPDQFPDYPSHTHVLSYLRALADRHRLGEHVTFGREVASAAPAPGGWRVTLDDGSADEYPGLVIATGHHWAPAVPEVSGAGFGGTVLHATEYRTPELFAGRRVIVVGLGNTAADIAVDAVYAGAEVTLSVRGGNHVVPKYLLGQPTDRLSKDVPLMRLSHRLPESLRTRLGMDERTMRTLGGKPERFGLPKPRHRLYDRQPLVNSTLLYHLGHGDIQIRPPVTELRSSGAVFADGTEERADILVWATGYQVSLPFCDVPAHLNGDRRGRPRLWLNMFHPARPDVVAVGLVDPLGSWTALDLQAQLAARHLAAVLSGHQAGSFHAVSELPEPVLGDGPDREWLFRGHDYTGELRAALDRLPEPPAEPPGTGPAGSVAHAQPAVDG